MSNESRFFRLRAAVRNSVVWGVAWGAIGTVAATAMRLIDKIPLGHAVLDGIGMGIRIGVMGGIAGAAFAQHLHEHARVGERKRRVQRGHAKRPPKQRVRGGRLPVRR